MSSKVCICGVDTSLLPKLKNSDMVELMERIKKGDRKARDYFVVANLRLVLSVVHRFGGRGDKADDMFQVGCVGLMKAIDNFDETLNVKFSTYAVPMIAGEIKRFLRDDGSIKVSRSIKNQYYLIQKFIDDYHSKNNCYPDYKQIANQFKIDEAELMFIIESSKMPVSIYDSLDREKSSATSVIDKIPDPRNTENEFVNKMLIKDLVNSLDSKDKKLIILRFFKDKTQSEVAKLLNVSQVQVSRLETKILNKLKNKLKE